MDKEQLTICSTVLEEQLLPRLVGHVFHVTTRDAFEKIQQCGAILSNEDLKFGNNWPKLKDSYFRRRGFISVFDLRFVDPVALEEALDRFYFLNPCFANRKPVFLILDGALHDSLVPWTEAQHDVGNAELWIPEVEAGIRERIPAALISSVLLVNVRETPEQRFFRQIAEEHALR